MYACTRSCVHDVLGHSVPTAPHAHHPCRPFVLASASAAAARYGALVLGRLYPGSDVFLDVASYTHVVRWAKHIEQVGRLSRVTCDRTGNHSLNVFVLYPKTRPTFSGRIDPTFHISCTRVVSEHCRTCLKGLKTHPQRILGAGLCPKRCLTLSCTFVACASGPPSSAANALTGHGARRNFRSPSDTAGQILWMCLLRSSLTAARLRWRRCLQTELQLAGLNRARVCSRCGWW